MCLNKALPDSVNISHDDYEWTQPLDYEHVPFRCCKCHALGHLFKDFQLNAKPQPPNPSNMQNQDGFTKVTNRKISHRKPLNGKKPQPEAASLPSTSNSFEILANTSEDPPLHSYSRLLPLSPSVIPPTPGSSSPPSQSEKNPGPTKEIKKFLSGKTKDMEVDAPSIHTMSTATAPEDMNQPQVMDEEPERFDLGGLDILELEAACKKKEFDKIPEHQLNTLEVILARAY